MTVLVVALIVAAVVVACGLAAGSLLLWRRRRQPRDPAARAERRFAEAVAAGDFEEAERQACLRVLMALRQGEAGWPPRRPPRVPPPGGGLWPFLPPWRL